MDKKRIFTKIIIIVLIIILILYYYPFKLRVFSIPVENEIFPIQVDSENRPSMGDGFQVWLIESELSESEKIEVEKDKNKLRQEGRWYVNPRSGTYFDVWIYDKKTEETKKILRFFNNHPQAPWVDAFGKKIVIGTPSLDYFILIDTTTGSIRNITWPENYIVSPISNNFNTNIYLYNNFIIYKTTLEIIKYDLNKGTYEVFAKAGGFFCDKNIVDIYVSDEGFVYWKEYADWCSKPTYRKKVQVGF